MAFIGLATNALLARLLSPSELGAYFLAYSVVGVCAALGSMGLTKAVVRFVAESAGLEQYGKTRRIIRAAFGLGSLGAVTVSVAYLLFGGTLVSRLFDSPALAAITGVIAGWILVVIVQGILVEAFRGFHDIRMTTLLGGIANGNGILTGGLFSLALLLLWIFSGETDLTAVVLLAAVSGAVTTILAGLLLRRRITSLPQDDFGVRFNGIQIMHVAWPLMVTALALFALGQSSLWIAGAFLSQEDVALYGAAYRLTLYVAVPLQIANVVAPPIIAEMYAQGRTEELQRTLRTLAATTGIPSFLLLVAFILFGGTVMELVFGEFYRSGAVLLAVLSLGQMVGVWAGSGGQALMMTGHQNTMMLVTLTTGLLTITGAIWAVQQYGTIGIAAAAAGGLILQNVVQLLLVRRKVGVWTHASFSGLFSIRRP